MKINAKKYFGVNKEATVKSTPNLVNMATDVQIAMLQDQDTERKITELDRLKESRDTGKLLSEFIQTVMKYTDKQMEQIGSNVEMSDYGEGLGYLIMRLNGMSDEDIDLSEKEDRRKAQEASTSK